jgi:hypothetical protein
VELGRLTVAGTFINDGALYVGGASTTGQALVSVGGGTPNALTGLVVLTGTATQASVVEYASGMTQLGAQLFINGQNAYMETASATGSNSALTGLKMISVGGALNLNGGASLSTTAA